MDELKEFHISDYLDNQEIKDEYLAQVLKDGDKDEYLAQVLKDGDKDEISQALGNIKKAKTLK
jgi:DNA-binding phage protein